MSETYFHFILLGRKGSNLRIIGSKPSALPLGYTPVGERGNRTLGTQMRTLL